MVKQPESIFGGMGVPRSTGVGAWVSKTSQFRCPGLWIGAKQGETEAFSFALIVRLGARRSVSS